MIAGGLFNRALLSVFRCIGHSGRSRRQGRHRALGQGGRDRDYDDWRLGTVAATASRCCSRHCSVSARTRPSSDRSSTRCSRSIFARTSSWPATRSSRRGHSWRFSWARSWAAASSSWRTVRRSWRHAVSVAPLRAGSRHVRSRRRCPIPRI
jgi:hypothetical protein